MKESVSIIEDPLQWIPAGEFKNRNDILCLSVNVQTLNKDRTLYGSFIDNLKLGTKHTLNILAQLDN